MAAYTLKKNLANKNNYGGRRNTAAIKYIVIHYTGNDGDSDEANANYFRRNIVKASAHYFVDDDSVTQSVPDDYVAWSVGGKYDRERVANELMAAVSDTEGREKADTLTEIAVAQVL